VRRSGAVAMPPFAGGRRAQCARRAGGRDFVGGQLPHAQAHAFRSGARTANYLSSSASDAAVVVGDAVQIRSQRPFSSLRRPVRGRCCTPTPRCLKIHTRAPARRFIAPCISGTNISCGTKRANAAAASICRCGRYTRAPKAIFRPAGEARRRCCRKAADRLDFPDDHPPPRYRGPPDPVRRPVRSSNKRGRAGANPGLHFPRPTRDKR